MKKVKKSFLTIALVTSDINYFFISGSTIKNAESGISIEKSILNK